MPAQPHADGGPNERLPEPFADIAARMGPVERSVLVEAADLSTADVQALLQELELDNRLLFSWIGAAPPVEMPQVLTESQCTTLRETVDEAALAAAGHAGNTEIDGALEWQLNLSPQRLADLIGADTVARLSAAAEDNLSQMRPAPLPAHSAGASCSQSSPPCPLPCVWAYIRRYSATTRPWFQFHYDACRVTMNIALDDDESHCGGHLLAIIDDGPGPPVEAQPKLRRLKRSLGSAVLHGCQVPHAVTRIFSGVRFALILFFGRPCPKPELDAAFGVQLMPHPMVLCPPSTLRQIYWRTEGHYHCDGCGCSVVDLGEVGCYHCAAGCEYDLCVRCYTLKRCIRQWRMARHDRNKCIEVSKGDI